MRRVPRVPWVPWVPPVARAAVAFFREVYFMAGELKLMIEGREVQEGNL
jgi:hypothetical protein